LIACSVLLLASWSLAQEKLDAQWNCPKPADTHSITVDDHAGHAYALNKTNCTAVKGEVGGVKEKDGAAAEFDDMMGNTVTWHGTFVETAENGDKIYYHYSSSGKGMTKDGQFQSGSNKWSMMGGTGKFAKAKGEGTCAGKGDGNGGATWDCTGTYTHN
jgi:hypothetical protein